MTMDRLKNTEISRTWMVLGAALLMALLLPMAAFAGDKDAEADTEEEPVEVVVYVTSWCPYCSMTTGHLDKRQITYTAIDIEKDATARSALARAIPWSGGIPVIKIGEEYVMGFDIAGIDKKLEAAGLYDPNPEADPSVADPPKPSIH